MIKYRLACGNGHEFEGWFPSIAGYDAQAASHNISCPHCGSSAVERAIMAPRVASHVDKASDKANGEPPVARDIPALMRRFRAEVEANADYVGRRFAEEARRLHDEDPESRGIYGEATLDEAQGLVDDGIPFLPLPRLAKDLN